MIHPHPHRREEEEEVFHYLVVQQYHFESFGRHAVGCTGCASSLATISFVEDCRFLVSGTHWRNDDGVGRGATTTRQVVPRRTMSSLAALCQPCCLIMRARRSIALDACYEEERTHVGSGILIGMLKVLARKSCVQLSPFSPLLNCQST